MSTGYGNCSGSGAGGSRLSFRNRLFIELRASSKTGSSRTSLKLKARGSELEARSSSRPAKQIEPVEIVLVKVQGEHHIKLRGGKKIANLLQIVPLLLGGAAVGFLVPLVGGYAPFINPWAFGIGQLD